jgi:hypothetical protein
VTKPEHRLTEGVSRAIGCGLLIGRLAEYHAYRQKKGRLLATFFLQVPRRLSRQTREFDEPIVEAIWWLIWDRIVPKFERMANQPLGKFS